MEFQEIYDLDLGDKVKKKKDLLYLSWASAWATAKKLDPDAHTVVLNQVIDDYGTERPWFSDGNYAWVGVETYLFGKKEVEWLPIMDYKNQAIPVEKVTATDANKACKRCEAKSWARHGIGLYLYEGEDIPQATKEIIDLRNDIAALMRKKTKISDDIKKKVIDLAKDAQRAAFPELEDHEITGSIADIEDEEILNDLKYKVVALRKPATTTKSKEKKEEK